MAIRREGRVQQFFTSPTEESERRAPVLWFSPLRGWRRRFESEGRDLQSARTGAAGVRYGVAGHARCSGWCGTKPSQRSQITARQAPLCACEGTRRRGAVARGAKKGKQKRKERWWGAQVRLVLPIPTPLSTVRARSLISSFLAPSPFASWLALALSLCRACALSLARCRGCLAVVALFA
mgnify:CR=1 FL=1